MRDSPGQTNDSLDLRCFRMLTLLCLAVGYLINHQQTPHYIPDEQGCELHCRKSPKSCKQPQCCITPLILPTWLPVFLLFSRLTRDATFIDIENSTAVLSRNYCCHGNATVSSLSSCYKLSSTTLLLTALPWKSNNDLWQFYVTVRSLNILTPSSNMPDIFYFCSILIKFGFSEILMKVSDIKIHAHSASGSRIDTCGWT